MRTRVPVEDEKRDKSKDKYTEKKVKRKDSSDDSATSNSESESEEETSSYVIGRNQISNRFACSILIQVRKNKIVKVILIYFNH